MKNFVLISLLLLYKFDTDAQICAILAPTPPRFATWKQLKGNHSMSRIAL